MFDDLKNEIAKKTKEILCQRQAKDIFEDDKLLQAEKRLQKYMQIIVNGYVFFLLGAGTLMYSFLFLYSYIEIGFGFFSLFLGIAFALVTMYFFYTGYQSFPRYKRFPLYLSRIADSKDGSLDKISASIGYPYEVVVSDIEFLIQKNILEKTYINHSQRVVISPVIGESISKSSVTQKCPNCGASISFIGQSVECEYCGSTISLHQ